MGQPLDTVGAPQTTPVVFLLDLAVRSRATAGRHGTRALVRTHGVVQDRWRVVATAGLIQAGRGPVLQRSAACPSAQTNILAYKHGLTYDRSMRRDQEGGRRGRKRKEERE